MAKLLDCVFWVKVVKPIIFNGISRHAGLQGHVWLSEPGRPGGVGEGKPSPRFSFGAGWECVLVKLIVQASTRFEAKASAEFVILSILPCVILLCVCLVCKSVGCYLAYRRKGDDLGQTGNLSKNGCGGKTKIRCAEALASKRVNALTDLLSKPTPSNNQTSPKLNILREGLPSPTPPGGPGRVS